MLTAPRQASQSRFAATSQPSASKSKASYRRWELGCDARCKIFRATSLSSSQSKTMSPSSSAKTPVTPQLRETRRDAPPPGHRSRSCQSSLGANSWRKRRSPKGYREMRVAIPDPPCVRRTLVRHLRAEGCQRKRVRTRATRLDDPVTVKPKPRVPRPRFP